ncbi:LacI family DNA-binding transcriptional regulator [Clavibacter michiganensis subsp. phaseoli]|uniref:LacI family DNA-binding transcriptional regulator n=1 Tax=Clavibacter phaseoli TaxID=1734031 RepID=A0A8I0SAS6_9MICO|nr:LacI family DNA-binding transcriptional regulator [Clavibacter phaseoli]MBF4632722.1 LacI family DNA-binding transcriptional regulator [Clavibacter phaseoli]
MSTRRATRDDVARLAGTSTAVVSYVINDGPRNVSDHLRKRVIAAMASLNYLPNALARSLTMVSTGTIGMIVPNISNAYFSELAREVENVAAKSGRLLFLGNSNETRHREAAYLQSFMERRVDGIVVIGVAHVTTIEAAQKAGVPIVVVDRDLDQLELPTVSIDHREAARAATAHLLEHGHTQIACLAGPADQPVAEERRLGWMDALLTAGLDASEAQVFRSDFSVSGGRSVAAAINRQRGHSAFTGLFVSSDDQARGFLAGANDEGLSIPTDIALVSVDGTREGRDVSPSLTTIAQPFTRLAEEALRLLTPNPDFRGHVYTPATLQIGRSCGCNQSSRDIADL